jgi:hypothetical protein
MFSAVYLVVSDQLVLEAYVMFSAVKIVIR